MVRRAEFRTKPIRSGRQSQTPELGAKQEPPTPRDHRQMHGRRIGTLQSLGGGLGGGAGDQQILDLDYKGGFDLDSRQYPPDLPSL